MRKWAEPIKLQNRSAVRSWKEGNPMGKRQDFGKGKAHPAESNTGWRLSQIPFSYLQETGEGRVKQMEKQMVLKGPVGCLTLASTKPCPYMGEARMHKQQQEIVSNSHEQVPLHFPPLV